MINYPSFFKSKYEKTFSKSKILMSYVSHISSISHILSMNYNFEGKYIFEISRNYDFAELLK